jgi:bifunctional DNA-binding transcriptional regulator/antitoxin component of YhaV-PrlF toxin-antitoxin module
VGYSHVITTIDAKHRLTIPKSLVQTEPGEMFETFYDAEEDEIILRRIKKKTNWAQVWLDCQVKTDEPLPKRSREYFRSKI